MKLCFVIKKNRREYFYFVIYWKWKQRSNFRGLMNILIEINDFSSGRRTDFVIWNNWNMKMRKNRDCSSGMFIRDVKKTIVTIIKKKYFLFQFIKFFSNYTLNEKSYVAVILQLSKFKSKIFLISVVVSYNFCLFFTFLRFFINIYIVSQNLLKTKNKLESTRISENVDN